MGNGNDPSPWFQTPEQTTEAVKTDNTQEDDGELDPTETTDALNLDKSLRGPKVAQQNLEQFRSEGVSEDVIDNYRLFPDHQNLRKLRAKQQGLFETVAKDGVKLIPKILGTTAEQAGYLGDIPAMVESIKALGKKFVDPSIAQDEDFEQQDNWLSELGRNWNEAWEDSLPTYREDTGAVWDPGDPAWWTKNISGLLETVTAFALTSKGLGALSRGATGLVAKGLSKGRNVSSTLGGARTSMAAERTAQGITTAGVSYAEGMMVGMQEYEKVHNRVKSKLQKSEKDLSPGEIEEIASQKAGQAAATTAGVNSLLLPGLNWLSVSPLFRSSRSLASLRNPKLAAQAGEQAFKKADDYLSRIKDLSGTAGMGRTGQSFLREGVLESVEEVSAQVAGGEGRASAFEDVGIEVSDAGERIVDNIFNPQTALESTLGFFGGVGQYGLLRNIPSQEAPDSFKPEEQGSAVRRLAEAAGVGSVFEGQISQSELEELREREASANDKETLEKRLNEFVEAQQDLQDAETEEEAREAADKLFRMAQAHEIARGAEHQLKGFLRDVANMDEGQADKLGFETDENSDYYYKRRAREKIEEIEKYTELYKELNSQYNFGAQEEFAGVPQAMLSLHMQRDSANQTIEDVEDAIDSIRRERQDQLDEREEAIYEELSRQSQIDDYEQRNELLSDIISVVENLDSEDKRNLSLLEIARGRGRNTENVDRLNELLANLSKSELREVRDAFRDINAQRAEEVLKEFHSRRTAEVENLRNQMPDGGPYAEFLQRANLENTEEARTLFKSLNERAKQEYDRKISKLEEIRQKAELRRQNAESNISHLEDSQNRQELVKRTKGLFEEERSDVADEVQSRLNTADSVEEVRQVKNSLDDEIVDAVGEDIFNEREEEIRDEESQQEVTEEDETQQEEDQTQEPEGRPEVFAEDRGEAEEREAEDLSFEDIVGESQTEEAPVDMDAAEESIRNWMTNNVDFSKDPSQINVEGKEEDLESFIEQFSDDLNESQIEELKSNFLGRDGEFRRKVYSSSFADTPIEDFNIAEVVGVINAPSTMDKLKEYREMADEETARSRHRNAFTGVSLGYKSKEYQNVVQRGENVLVNKYNTRSDNLDNPLVEHPDHFREGDEVVFVPEELDTSDDIPNHASENERMRIAVYRNGVKSGYLWHPYRIDETNTLQDDKYAPPSGYKQGPPKNNVETQKIYNQNLRNTVMEAYEKNGGNPVRGEVSIPPGGNFAKSPGRLSIRYETNEDGTIKIDNEYPVRDYRPASENMPQSDLPLYVMRGNSLHTNDGKDYDVINSEEFFEGNEGSIGAIVPMANGKNLAVPLWSPTLEEAGHVDTVTQLIMESTKEDGEKAVFDKVDLNNPSDFETQMENYVHTNSYSPSQIFNIFDNEELVGREIPVFVVSQSGNVTLGIPGSGAVFTNIEEFHSEPGYQPIQGNEEAVRDIVKKARFDVRADRINDYDEGTTDDVIPGAESGETVITTDDAGQLTTKTVDSYNEHVKNNLYTDVDGRHTVNGDHIYAEQPVITLTVTTGDPDVEHYQSTPKPNPNDDTTPTSDPSDDQSSVENEDVEGDNTEGDTQDIESPANTIEEEVDQRATEIAQEIQQSDEMETVDDYIEQNQEEVEQQVDAEPYDSIDEAFEDVGSEEEALEMGFPSIAIEQLHQFEGDEKYTEIFNKKLETLRRAAEEKPIGMPEEIHDRVVATYNKFADTPIRQTEVEDTLEASVARDLRDQIEVVLEQERQDPNNILQSIATDLNETNIENLDDTDELIRLLDEVERAEELQFDDTEANVENYNDIQSAKTTIKSRLSELGFDLEGDSAQQTETPQSDEEYDVPEWGDDFDDEFIGNEAFDTVTSNRVESVNSGVTESEASNEQVLEAFQSEEDAQITCKVA